MDKLFNNRFAVALLCFLSGSFCALGMPPYNFWPVFLIGFGCLYMAIDRSTSKRMAFISGWLWAFGYFVFSLYWIGNALLVEGNPYKWAWPLAVCGLPALLAFFNAFACLMAYRFLSLEKWHGYMGFVFLIGVFEWLRGHLFTGFPWNLYGYTWVDISEISQIASLESVYLLTFLSVFWLSTLGFVFTAKCAKSKALISLAALLTLFSSFVFGHIRMQETVVYHDDISVKIIQPSTPQAEKWQRAKMDTHFQKALSMSRATPQESEKTIIVWPETALSPTFTNSEYYRNQIGEVLNDYQGEAVLMTGALRYQKDTGAYHNSLITINEQGAIQDVYDKSHLVPFGEYIPFQKWIPLKPVVQFQGFKKGSGPRDLSLFSGTLHYSPLVCYEIIFPNQSTQKGSRADFIVNVTNDAWYGKSAGPYQHLAITRFRAIEKGIPVLRAANTGVSTVIDPYGQIVQGSELFAQNILKTQLPKGLAF